MAHFYAALPMYDMPECAAQNNAYWQGIDDRLRADGFTGRVTYLRPSIGEGPNNLLVHPNLLLSQTCWGPIWRGVTPRLTILAQPDYSRFSGGKGSYYRSAIIARGAGVNVPPPKDNTAVLPIEEMRRGRFAFNDETSLSGYLSIIDDVTKATKSDLPFYASSIASGSHRNSIKMVAGCEADFAALDCRTWALACEHEPAANDVHVIGWTSLRMGLPYVCSPKIKAGVVRSLRAILLETGCVAPAVMAA